MSRIGTLDYRNEIFLGQEELNRRQELERNVFLCLLRKFGDSGLFNLEKSYLLTYIKDSDAGIITVSLKLKNNYSDLIGISGAKPIYIENSKTISIPEDTGFPFYLGIKGVVSSYEKGTVSLSSDGYLQGTNTEFTKLLRSGQYKRKSRIKINEKVYVVEKVVNDTALYLSNVGSETISGAKYMVLPTISPFSDDDSEPLYLFDSCELVMSTEVFDEKDTFQIAEVKSLDSLSGTLEFSQKTLLRNLDIDLVGTNDILDEAITLDKISKDTVQNLKSLFTYKEVELTSEAPSIKVEPGYFYNIDANATTGTNKILIDWAEEYIGRSCKVMVWPFDGENFDPKDGFSFLNITEVNSISYGLPVVQGLSDGLLVEFMWLPDHMGQFIGYQKVSREI